jgi:hypothetical protein
MNPGQNHTFPIIRTTNQALGTLIEINFHWEMKTAVN